MPPRSKWIGGVDGRTPLADGARTILEARLAPIHPLLTLAHKRHEEDIEYVHQLRVAVRRAEAAMRAFRPCCREKRWKRLSKRLKTIRRAAGGARETDVLGAKLADRIAGADEADRPLLEYALQQTRQERRNAQQDLNEVAERYLKKKLQRAIGKLLDRIDAPARDRLDLRSNGAPPPRSDDLTLLDLALVRLSQGLGAVKEAAAADPGVFENLHALRIESKGLRYAMEIFASCFDDRFRKELYPDFKVLQDHLGEINDAHEMALRFDRYADELTPASDGNPDAELAAGLHRLADAGRADRDRLRAEFLAWWEEFRTNGVLRRIEDYVELPMAPA
ncbi:MAG: CHAD domain-containing protein [Planctomycetota bacterium]|nr:CHAD domain-containing protein [Planctomycetota bacterium]